MKKPIVFIACTIACQATATPPTKTPPTAMPTAMPERIYTNPPPIEPFVEPPTTDPMAPVAFTGAPFHLIVGPPINPKVDGKSVYRSSDQTCFVHGEFPDDAAPRIPGMSPPKVPVDCPDALNDAVYDLCTNGAIYEYRGSCGCFVMGNPPTAARALSRCPAVASPDPGE